MAHVKSSIKGKWLQDAFDALDISVSEAASQMGLDSPRSLHKHIHPEGGHLGSAYLHLLKVTFPAINLNYIVAGEPPILLTPQPQTEALRKALTQIHELAVNALEARK